MKKIVKESLCVILGITVCGCTKQETKSASEISYKSEINQYVEAIDMDYAYQLTKTLSQDTSMHDNELGFRTSGSDGEHAAADFLVKEMESIGLQEVEKVPVTVDKWQFNGASLTLEGTSINLSPVSYMVNGTDKDGLQTEIVDCGTGFANDYEEKDVKGKIALVGVDQYNEAWIDGYVYEAYEHGASAIVTYDIDGYGRYSDDEHQIQDVCCEDLIPVVCITKNEYEAVAEEIKNGNTNANLTVDSEMKENGGTSYNVVGKIPGKNHSQQIIFAGHYDMYFTGFQDDCSAVSTAMSMAKAMLDSGYTPENDIVVVAHGAEEWGATGSEFDWTRGAYEMIYHAHPEWAEKTLALFNFELSAYDPGFTQFSITSVPEYATLVKTLGEEGVFDESVKEFSDGINLVTYDSTTMEDGVTYRGAGVPYFLNTTDTCADVEIPEGYSWTELHYHTESDNAETYSEKWMKANIGVFGSLAIAIDQLPAIQLNFERTCADLEETLDLQYASEAGVDIDAWNDNLQAFQKKAKEVNEHAQDINTRYLKATSQSEREAIQKEGVSFNKDTLSLFKKLQDAFIGIEFSSDVVMRHEGYQNNLVLLDGILSALDAKELNNEEETGALDLAYQLNALCEYNYYIFSKETGERIDAHADASIEANRWWGNNKGYIFTDTHDATTSLLNKTKEDDFSKEKEIYRKAREEQLEYFAEIVNQEIEELKNLTK